MTPESHAPQMTPKPTVPQPHSSMQWWGAVLAVVIVLGFIVSVLIIKVLPNSSGTVSVIVYSTDGTSVIESVALRSGKTTLRTDVPDEQTRALTPPVVTLLDGSYITLTPAGIVRKIGGPQGQTEILVASIEHPSGNTPLAVWGDGERIAWTSPTDGSIQVFTRSSRNTYVPSYISSALKANSLGFTEDGSALVIGTVTVERGGSVTTDLSTVDLVSQSSPVHVVTINGFARILSL